MRTKCCSSVRAICFKNTITLHMLHWPFSFLFFPVVVVHSACHLVYLTDFAVSNWLHDCLRLTIIIDYLTTVSDSQAKPSPPTPQKPLVLFCSSWLLFSIWIQMFDGDEHMLCVLACVFVCALFCLARSEEVDSAYGW